MPDSFDPDAWPRDNTTPSNGFGGQKKPNQPDSTGSGSHSRSDDDFGANGGNDEIDLRDGTDDGDDDFGTFNYDFDEDAALRRQPSPIATSTKQNDDDLFDDDPYASPYDSKSYDRGADDNDNDNDNGYDDFDRYDDFADREPRQGGGVKRTLIGVFAVISLIAALSFAAVALLGRDDKEVAQPPPTPQLPQLVPPSGEGTPAATPEPPPEVTNRLDEALAAWGRFSVTGDLDEVRPYFVPSSKQFAHFESTEAPAIKANPVSGPPFRMAMSGERIVTQGSDGNWKIAGTVTADRPDEQPQNLRWEFTLTRANENEPWQILQVRQF